MNHKSVAIDGPAGAGKSTLARRLAEKLGYLYVDTGAIYRTVALTALRAGADPADPARVVPLLEGLDIRMGYGEDGVQRMYLGGEDVSQAIRENQQEMGKELSHQVSTQVVKEMDYLFRLQEEREETHYKKLDELIRSSQKQRRLLALGKKREKKVKEPKIKEAKVKEPKNKIKEERKKKAEQEIRKDCESFQKFLKSPLYSYLNNL